MLVSVSLVQCIICSHFADIRRKEAVIQGKDMRGRKEPGQIMNMYSCDHGGQDLDI